jgi:cytochrome c biogenesis protein ResB
MGYSTDSHIVMVIVLAKNGNGGLICHVGLMQIISGAVIEKVLFRTAGIIVGVS